MQIRDRCLWLNHPFIKFLPYTQSYSWKATKTPTLESHGKCCWRRGFRAAFVAVYWIKNVGNFIWKLDFKELIVTCVHSSKFNSVKLTENYERYDWKRDTFSGSQTAMCDFFECFILWCRDDFMFLSQEGLLERRGHKHYVILVMIYILKENLK